MTRQLDRGRSWRRQRRLLGPGLPVVVAVFSLLCLYVFLLDGNAGPVVLNREAGQAGADAAWGTGLVLDARHVNATRLDVAHQALGPGAGIVTWGHRGDGVRAVRN